MHKYFYIKVRIEQTDCDSLLLNDRLVTNQNYKEMTIILLIHGSLVTLDCPSGQILAGVAGGHLTRYQYNNHCQQLN